MSIEMGRSTFNMMPVDLPLLIGLRVSFWAHVCCNMLTVCVLMFFCILL